MVQSGSQSSLVQGPSTVGYNTSHGPTTFSEPGLERHSSRSATEDSSNQRAGHFQGCQKITHTSVCDKLAIRDRQVIHFEIQDKEVWQIWMTYHGKGDVSLFGHVS